MAISLSHVACSKANDSNFQASSFDNTSTPKKENQKKEKEASEPAYKVFGYVFDWSNGNIHKAFFDGPTEEVSVGVPITSGSPPYENEVLQIAPHPSGKFLYALNRASFKLSVYGILQNGDLEVKTECDSDYSEISTAPRSILVHPNGNYLYLGVDDSPEDGPQNNGQLIVYEITENACLDLITTASSGSNHVRDMQIVQNIDENGNELSSFLYLVDEFNGGPNRVGVFKITGDGASLEFKENFGFSSDERPFYLDIHPSRKFLVASIFRGGDVAGKVFSIRIQEDGGLELPSGLGISGEGFVATGIGQNTREISIHPEGSMAFVANSGPGPYGEPHSDPAKIRPIQIFQDGSLKKLSSYQQADRRFMGLKVHPQLDYIFATHYYAGGFGVYKITDIQTGSLQELVFIDGSEFQGTWGVEFAEVPQPLKD